MRKLILILFILPLAARAQNFATKADAYLSDLTKQGQFTGSVLVAKKGQILFQKAYGFADFESKKPNTSEIQFRIASLSKQFCAALILQLVEKGKLSVQDKLSKFIPDYPNGDSITVRNLLTHTSGIPEISRLRDFNRFNVAGADLDKKIAFFKNQPAVCKPGARFDYSNSNYFLLSFIAQKLSGQSYDDLLQKQILDKAGMKNSGVNKIKGSAANMSTGYATLGDNWTLAPPRDYTEGYGAAGMYSTTGDLYKWDRALNGTSILSEASKKQMFTPGMQNYGFGYYIVRAAGHQEYNHTGVTNGFLSVIARYPDDDACIIVLMNSSVMKPPVVKKALSDMLFAQ